MNSNTQTNTTGMGSSPALRADVFARGLPPTLRDLPTQNYNFSPDKGAFNKLTLPPVATRPLLLEELLNAMFEGWLKHGMVKDGGLYTKKVSISLEDLRQLFDPALCDSNVSPSSQIILPHLSDHLTAFYEYWMELWSQEKPIAQLIVGTNKHEVQTQFFHRDGGQVLIYHFVGEHYGTRFALDGIDHTKLIPGMDLRDHRFTKFEEFMLLTGRRDQLKPGEFAIFDGNIPHAATTPHRAGDLRAALLLAVASNRNIDPKENERLLLKLYDRLLKIKAAYEESIKISPQLGTPPSATNW